MSVTIGSSAFGNACERRIRPSVRPFARAVVDVVLGARLDDRGAHEDRVAADQAEARPSRAAGPGARTKSTQLVDRTSRTSPPTVSMPEVGNQPSPAAKMMISGMPITKYGIE